MAKAPRVEMSRDFAMLTTMKVSADMLWVVTPASAPMPNAATRLSVHRLAMRRRRRPASALRFSVRSHIPTKKSPTPPIIPPNRSNMRAAS